MTCVWNWEAGSQYECWQLEFAGRANNRRLRFQWIAYLKELSFKWSFVFVSALVWVLTSLLSYKNQTLKRNDQFSSHSLTMTPGQCLLLLPVFVTWLFLENFSLRDHRQWHMAVEQDLWIQRPFYWTEGERERNTLGQSYLAHHITNHTGFGGKIKWGYHVHFPELLGYKWKKWREMYVTQRARWCEELVPS